MKIFKKKYIYNIEFLPQNKTKPDWEAGTKLFLTCPF